MAKYELFDEILLIPDSYIRKHNMNTRAWEASEKAEQEFDKWYRKCLGIDGVLRGYYEIASTLLKNYVVDRLFNQLANLNIYDINEDMYISKVIDFGKIDSAYDSVESELEEIIEDKNEMEQYRAARKANRGRFVGGGFGLSGAIKGSMKAGALNATTGLAHGAVNVIGNMGSAVGASLKKAALYNQDTKETLSTGIYLAVGRAYDNHMKLVNSYIRGYYESGFDPNKAIALFENAKKIPSKREELLFQAVQCCPEEDILSYIFVNYPDERKSVYKIGQAFEIDFGKYIEDSFARSYTESVKNDPDKVEKVKSDILKAMKEYGITESATLKKINRDMLVYIIQKYNNNSIETSVNDDILKRFLRYAAPEDQKKQVVHEYGVWELAKELDVVFSDEEREQILRRYYTDSAKSDEGEALKVKKKLQEIMEDMSCTDSLTFNQLEKDCIKRICGDIGTASEGQCNLLRQKVSEYDALDKNKQEFLDAIQARIEAIWSKEDGEIFDNVYMNTDLYDQTQINNALDFIKQKGRTSNSEKYITALESCTPKNIKRAKKYNRNSTTVFNIIGIFLFVVGVVCMFSVAPAGLIAIPGVLLMVNYYLTKRIWNILTIDGTQIHTMLLNGGATSVSFDRKLVDSRISLNNNCTDSNDGVESARIEAERKIEEMSRTFNGVIYASVEEMNAAKREFAQQEILKKNEKKYNMIAIISMLCGIVAAPLLLTAIFWVPVCISAVVFGIIALVNKARKKGFAIAGIVLAGIVLGFFILVIAIPEDSNNQAAVSQEQQEKNQKYFEIVHIIDDGKYDEAATSIQTYYGQSDYKGTEGWNRANLQRLMYHKQEKWDDEMGIILDYFAENSDFKDVIAGGGSDAINYSAMISCANDILDLVLPKNKQAAIDLIGEDLLRGEK